MKTARFILKIVAAVMTLAAIVCAIIAFWDQIMDLFDTVVDKLEEKRANCCFESEEPEDFADYDDSIM